ncbi:FtsX-like permease family protein [Bifidobacterium sp. ESL0769]|uniref:ABC transporter permease n=1 Tax=Bifidobacterium sp. ESL0769 TaxID=2983229 RepID=UPI0023FA0325|nr:FtsX-like permease family protein [Bifidobacterium sp. ESL0769]WEV67551.1 FtsX-like permease family protein [Bifidobacterium sp. ESL0769]
MTNRQMFFRMLFSAVFRRRSRAMMAVVASLVGAATLFCLAAICVAVPQQMNEEMRAYGANLIVAPTQRTVGGKAVDSSKTTNVADSGFDQKTVAALNSTVKNVGSERSAAYRYENTRINSLPFVVAGIDPHDVKALNHHWSVEGKWPSSGGVMLGRDAATKLDAKIGSVITIKYSPGKSVAAATDGTGASSSSGAGSESSGSSGSGNGGTSSGSNTSGSGSSSSSSTEGNSSGHDMSNMKGMKMSDSSHADNIQQGMADATVKDKLGKALDGISSEAKTPDMPDMDMSHMGTHGMGDMPGMKMSASDPGSVNLAEWKSLETTSSEQARNYSVAVESAGYGLTGTTGGNADTHSGSVQLAEWKPTAPNAGGMEFRVDGIVDTGGSEDDMVYANNLDVDKLTGFERGADVVEFSVDASDAGLNSLVSSVNKKASLNAKAQKVTKITSSNVRIITMLQTLFWIVTVVVLVLTLVGVGTTISSIVSQRRNEIGLRKALGASSRNIAVEFTVEAALYGLIGGLLGTAIGYVLAYALSASVFGQKLSLNWPLALASVLVSMLVAVLASLPPVRNAVRIDPAVVLQEE